MITIQDTIKRAIALRAPDILADKKQLCILLEDLSPVLKEELEFIEKVYSDEVGSLFFKAYTADEIHKGGYLADADHCLEENYGFHEKWRKKLFSCFGYDRSKVVPRHAAASDVKTVNVKEIFEEAETAEKSGYLVKAANLYECIHDRSDYERRAQMFLGKYYEHLPSVSFHHYLRAANLGDPKGQFFVGYMYEYGEGTDRNTDQAVKWYTKAADHGNRDARHHLGYFYYSGTGVKQDLQKAFAYFQLAAQQGKADAMRNLGVMYETGQYVGQDLDEAARWYQMASDNGDSDAYRFYTQIVRKRSGHNKNHKVKLRILSQGEDKREEEFLAGDLMTGWQISKNLSSGYLLKILYHEQAHEIGIKNMSDASWTIVCPDLSKKICEPGQIQVLEKDMMIRIIPRMVQLNVIDLQ